MTGTPPSHAVGGTDVLQEDFLRDAKILQDLSMAELQKIDAETVRLSQQEKTALQEKVAHFSYLAARGKGFIEAKAALMFFKFPDALIWEGLLMFTRYAVVYPAMVAAGQGWLIPWVEFLPVELSLTAPYVWLRSIMNRKILGYRIGVDPQLLKSLLFQDLNLDMNNAELHRVRLETEDYLTIPVSDAKENMNWISTEELEKLVDARSPGFVRQLKLLHMDPWFYQHALLERVFSDIESAEALSLKTKALVFDGAGAEDKKNLVEFVQQTDEFLGRLKVEGETLAPPASYWDVRKLLPWFRGFLMRMRIAMKAQRFRYFQVRTLGAYQLARSQDPALARQILKKGLYDLPAERARVVWLLQEMKRKFPPEPRTLPALRPVGPRCQELFAR